MENLLTGHVASLRGHLPYFGLIKLVLRSEIFRATCVARQLQNKLMARFSYSFLLHSVLFSGYTPAAGIIFLSADRPQNRLGATLVDGQMHRVMFHLCNLQRSFFTFATASATCITILNVTHTRSSYKVRYSAPISMGSCKLQKSLQRAITLSKLPTFPLNRHCTPSCRKEDAFYQGKRNSGSIATESNLVKPLKH